MKRERIHVASGNGTNEAMGAMLQGANLAAEHLEDLHRFLDGGIGLRWDEPKNDLPDEDIRDLANAMRTIQGPQLFRGQKLLGWIEISFSFDGDGDVRIAMSAHNADEHEVTARLRAAGVMESDGVS